MKKQITLKRLTLLNFKGIRNLTIEFDSLITSIFADNGLGKTTIMDAFLWLLFGKDSQDRKDFEVKTLDKHNQPIPKIDHEVTAVIEVNGKEITLQRTLREKWVKKRGSAVPEFTGNETIYSWNDVPMQAKEYQAKITDILDENIFKLITNPLAFNALKWQDRREVLMGMCGELNDMELASSNKEYAALVGLLSDKTLEELKKETSAKRKKINDSLRMIPTRIDEVQRNTPTPLDFAGIRKEIEAKEAFIKEIEAQISDKSKSLEKELQKRSEVQTKIYEVRNQITGLTNEAKQKAKSALTIDYTELRELERQRDAKTGYLKQYEREVISIQEKIKTIEADIASKRAAWAGENSRELSFGDEDFHCPTCKREFEEGDVESKKAEMLENFKADKAKKLQAINTQGKALKLSLEENKERLNKGVQTVTEVKGSIAELNSLIEAENSRIESLRTGETEVTLMEKYLEETSFSDLQKELGELESQLGEAPTVDTSELQHKITAAQVDLDHLKSQLSVEATIKNAQVRIAELEKEEESLSATLMELEGQEFTLENFIKLKIETLEERINSQFKYVNFKLFDVQINGGIVETCEALIDGVPFSNANTASRVNAGIDIINSLCEYYGVAAPVWIDNAESIVEILPTDSQLIRLVVSEADKALRVEAGKLEKEVA